MTGAEAERLARLEAQVESMSKRMDAQGQTLQEVRDAVVGARGAKWAIITLISVSGIVGGFLSSFLPLPK